MLYTGRIFLPSLKRKRAARREQLFSSYFTFERANLLFLNPQERNTLPSCFLDGNAAKEGQRSLKETTARARPVVIPVYSRTIFHLPDVSLLHVTLVYESDRHDSTRGLRLFIGFACFSPPECLEICARQLRRIHRIPVTPWDSRSNNIGGPRCPSFQN